MSGNFSDLKNMLESGQIDHQMKFELSLPEFKQLLKMDRSGINLQNITVSLESIQDNNSLRQLIRVCQRNEVNIADILSNIDINKLMINIGSLGNLMSIDFVNEDENENTRLLENLLSRVDITALIKNMDDFNQLLSSDSNRIYLIMSRIDIHKLIRKLHGLEDSAPIDEETVNRFISYVSTSFWNLKKLLLITDPKINAVIQKIDFSKLIRNIFDLQQLLQISDPRVNVAAVIQKIDFSKWVLYISDLEYLLKVSDPRVDTVNIISSVVRCFTDFIVLLQLSDPKVTAAIRKIDVPSLMNSIANVNELLILSDPRVNVDAIIPNINLSNLVHNFYDLKLLLQISDPKVNVDTAIPNIDVSGLIQDISEFKQLLQLTGPRVNDLISRINIHKLIRRIGNLEDSAHIDNEKVSEFISSVTTSFGKFKKLLLITDPNMEIPIKNRTIFNFVIMISDLRQLLQINDPRINVNTLLNNIDVPSLIHLVSDLEELFQINDPRIDVNDVINRINVSELIYDIYRLHELLQIDDPRVSAITQKINVYDLIYSFSDLHDLLQINDPRVNISSLFKSTALKDINELYDRFCNTPAPLRSIAEDLGKIIDQRKQQLRAGTNRQDLDTRVEYTIWNSDNIIRLLKLCEFLISENTEESQKKEDIKSLLENILLDIFQLEQHYKRNPSELLEIPLTQEEDLDIRKEKMEANELLGEILLKIVEENSNNENLDDNLKQELITIIEGGAGLNEYCIFFSDVPTYPLSGIALAMNTYRDKKYLGEVAELLVSYGANQHLIDNYQNSWSEYLNQRSWEGENKTNFEAHVVAGKEKYSQMKDKLELIRLINSGYFEQLGNLESNHMMEETQRLITQRINHLVSNAAKIVEFYKTEVLPLDIPQQIDTHKKHLASKLDEIANEKKHLEQELDANKDSLLQVFRIRQKIGALLSQKNEVTTITQGRIEKLETLGSEKRLSYEKMRTYIENLKKYLDKIKHQKDESSTKYQYIDALETGIKQLEKELQELTSIENPCKTMGN